MDTSPRMYLLSLEVTGGRQEAGKHTHVALERLLPGMRPRVLVQAALLAEGLAALWALVGLLLQSGKRPGTRVSAGPSSGRGTSGRILASSARCSSTLTGAMNSYNSAAETGAHKTLLGSLKTTTWFTAPASESPPFFPFSPDCPKEDSAGLLWPNHLLDWTLRFSFHLGEPAKRASPKQTVWDPWLTCCKLFTVSKGFLEMKAQSKV